MAAPAGAEFSGHGFADLRLPFTLNGIAHILVIRDVPVRSDNIEHDSEPEGSWVREPDPDDQSEGLPEPEGVGGWDLDYETLIYRNLAAGDR